MNYETIKGYAEDSFIERKSEFIGYIKPVTTNDEAVAFIEEIRAKHRKATHNVYAYILRDGNISRYSDDGEPQGTAGVPVYEVIKKENLTDVLRKCSGHGHTYHMRLSRYRLCSKRF